MSEAEPATADVSPGRVLAAARGELKLSLADVSQQIKYAVRQIEAIESDDYAKLPGTTFVRGMIRSYAKLVQLDPAPLLANLGRRDTPPAATVNLGTDGQEPFIEGGGKSNRIYVSLSVAALVAVAVVVYEWQISPPDTGEVVKITSKAAPAITSKAAPADARPPAPAPAPPVPSAAAAPAPVSVPVPPAPGDAQAAQPRAGTDAPAAPASGSGLKRIDLAFEQPSWVEIKQADGKLLLSQLNPAGTSQVIEGVPPFAIVIGNAAKVRLKYNDAPVDLRPYFKVDVARLKLE